MTRAIELLEDCVKGHSDNEGVRSPITCNVKMELAIVLMESGDGERGILLNQGVVAVFEKELGPHHPETLRAKVNLANFTLNSGKLDMAKALYVDIIDGFTSISKLGPKHPKTLEMKLNLARVEKKAQRMREAIALSEECAAGFEEHFGPDHPKTQKAKRFEFDLKAAHSGAL